MFPYIENTLGGMGLLLLGMWLMTDGLRLAAGPSLGQVLARWTATRQRSLLVGIGVTALMQSSTASTMATLGFVNAGILSFERAVWIVFGSNIGTTLTAWLVALIGFKLGVEAIALPLLGVGAFLHLMSRGERLRAIGMACAGFGMLFLGIDFLSDSFRDLSSQVHVDALRMGPWLTPLLMVIIGIVLTTLMQTSIAAITLAMALASGGLLTLTEGAAMVIGANIGTTTTALLASIGATANARRLAAAHVLFNLTTGAVAVLLLPWFMAALLALCAVLDIGAEPTVLLALFHSAFNLLGVLLMWPLEPHMSRFLLRHFREREEHPAVARFIDRNVASMPGLALHALEHELDRLIRQYPVDIDALLYKRQPYAEQARARQDLLAQIGDFITEASRQAIHSDAAQQFGLGWRVQHNLANTEDSLRQLNGLLQQLAQEQAVEVPALQAWLHTLRLRMEQFLGDETLPETFAPLYPEYEKHKEALIAAGLGGELSQQALSTSLLVCSSSRRLVEQWLRALHYCRHLIRQPNAPAAPAHRDAGALPENNHGLPENGAIGNGNGNGTPPAA